jgi:hypothetical protein
LASGGKNSGVKSSVPREAEEKGSKSRLAIAEVSIKRHTCEKKSYDLIRIRRVTVTMRNMFHFYISHSQQHAQRYRFTFTASSAARRACAVPLGVQSDGSRRRST